MIGELVSGMGAQTLQYGSGQGDPRLRERICDVMALEGITDASPSEVVVTVGSQQGLDLVTRVFCDPGDVILAEGPSYVGALGVFQAAEARVRHVAMDDHGLIPEALEEALVDCRANGDRVKFLYTVPNFHNPAGVTLSEPRREAIVALAEKHDLLIIEDNPYGLLGFDHEPMRALRARNSQRVIYLGSFSKTFSPGLRVGWVLAPLAVREKLVLATEAQVLCPPSLTQYAVARYLDTQPWREQIKLFTELYRERRDATPGVAGRAHAGRHRLDPARGRLLRLAEAAARARRQAHAAPGGQRARRLRARHRLLRRRQRPRVHAAVLLLPRARPDPRGRAPAGPRHRGRAGPALHLRRGRHRHASARSAAPAARAAPTRADRRAGQQRHLRGRPA